jgi:hypothetical protein
MTKVTSFVVFLAFRYCVSITFLSSLPLLA